MSSRISLYAHSVRNTLGRKFGTTWAYTPAQIATAKAMWTVLRTRYDEPTSAAVLGCVDGECSFLLMARGDHDLAGGAFQWHADRRTAIKLHTMPAIDVWSAGASDQARAFMTEISTPWPGNAYCHVEAALTAAAGLEAKMTVLVSKFERSGSQARDIARRTLMAAHWLTVFGTAAS